MIRFDWRALCLSILTGLVLTSFAWPYLTATQTYPDTIASVLGFRGEVKTSDFQALAILFVVSTAVYIGWTWVLSRAPAVPVDVPLAWASYYVGHRLVNWEGTLVWAEPVAYSVCLAGLGLLALRLPALQRTRATRVLAAAALIGAGVASGLGGGAWAVAIAFALAAAGLFATRSDRWLLPLLYGAQALAPLLLIHLLPRAVEHRGVTYPAEWRWTLLLAIVMVAAAGWWSLLLRFRREQSVGLRRHLDPLCLAPVVLLAGIAAIGFPAIPFDDFHLGEQLLPWQQWMSFGRVPYLDLVPIHGLMPMARSALNVLFFDGSVGRFMNAFALLNAGTAAMAFALLLWRAGRMPALLFLISIPVSDRLYLLGPVLLLLTLPGLWDRPARWVWVAAVCSILLVAYNLPAGGAASVGIAVLFVIQSRRLYAERRFPMGLAICGGVVLAALLLPDLRAVLAAYLEFARDNSAINATAHSMAWGGITATPTPYPGVLHSSLLFEILKYSWIGVALVLAVIAARTRHALAILAVVTLLALTPWSMGRIGDGGLSRPGRASHYFAVVLLPAVMLRQRMLRSGAPWLALAFLAGVYQAANGRPAFSLQAAHEFSSREPIRVPEGHERVTGFKNLGVVYLEPARAAEIRNVCSTVEQFAGPAGAYLDLTNRQAFYAYCGRMAPSKYPAPYVAASSRLQRQMLAQLQSAAVPLVWAEPAIPFGDPPVHVRNYLLFRHVVTRYTPCKVGEFLFFVLPGKCAGAGNPLALMEPMVWRDLGRLPETWGKSWDSLKARFADPAAVTPSTPVDPRVHDFLSIRLDCTSCNPSPVTVRWTPDPAGGPSQMKFSSGPGRALVPLGAYPDWLLARQIASLSVEPAGGLSVSELTLLRYLPE